MGPRNHTRSEAVDAFTRWSALFVYLFAVFVVKATVWPLTGWIDFFVSFRALAVRLVLAAYVGLQKLKKRSSWVRGLLKPFDGALAWADKTVRRGPSLGVQAVLLAICVFALWRAPEAVDIVAPVKSELAVCEPGDPTLQVDQWNDRNYLNYRAPAQTCRLQPPGNCDKFACSFRKDPTNGGAAPEYFWAEVYRGASDVKKLKLTVKAPPPFIFADVVNDASFKLEWPTDAEHRPSGRTEFSLEARDEQARSIIRAYFTMAYPTGDSGVPRPVPNQFSLSVVLSRESTKYFEETLGPYPRYW